MLIDKAPNTASMVPDFLADLAEFSALYSAQDVLLQDYFQALSDFYADAFPATATRPALTRFLSFLKLPQPEDTQACRALLIGKLASHPPFNFTTVESICKAYLGENGSLQYFHDQGTIQVKYPPDFEQSDMLTQALRALIPAALLLIVRENYLAFNDLDAASLTWAQLDSKNAIFETLPDLNL